MLERLVLNFCENPKRLFLIDGIGALTSAFVLGVVLVNLQPHFGIPIPTLYFLASLPCVFMIYDCYFYFKKQSNLGRSLNGIALINISYSFLSIGLACYHYQKITSLGWTYILVEIAIVLGLSILELQVAKRLLNS